MLLAIAAITVADAQCQYCNTYEDFVAGRWQKLDTVYCESHSKSEKILLGINDFSLTTGDKALDKNLKKEAFIVKQVDTQPAIRKDQFWQRLYQSQASGEE